MSASNGIASATSITAGRVYGLKGTKPWRRAGAQPRTQPRDRPPAVGQRVLDRLHPPAFLVEHRVADDAADRQLAVLLDRVVLEVLVAAVAVEEVAPVGVARADAGHQRQVHRRALDVERLVVLDDRDRGERVDLLGPRRDRLAEHLEPGAAQKLARLLEVRAAAVHRQGEGLEPRRALAEVEEHAVERQQDGAAVEAAREEDAERLARRQRR